MTDGAAGAGSARARRLASMYDARSPPAGGRAGVGAVKDGATGGDAMSGAGRLSAITGGAGGGRAAIGGRAWSVGDGGVRSAGEGGGAGGGPGGGARRNVNWPRGSPRSGSSSDGRRIRGSHCHMTATCMSSDSASATQMVGIVTLSRLLRDSSGQSRIGYSNE